MLAEDHDLAAGRAGKVIVRPNRTVLPGYLWIGREDKS
jgi:hypothetical protein